VSVTSGEYEQTTLDWASRSGTSIGALENGPILSGSVSGGYERLQTSGDFAATIGCGVASSADPDPQCTLYVVQLSTKTVYRLASRPGGNVFGSLLALSPTEVVVAETDYPRHPPFNTIDRVIRIDLGALPNLSW
jgi:hypothetical protein